MNGRLKILLFSNSLFVLGGVMIIPTYSLFVTELGGGPKLAGLLYSVHFIANFITALIVIRIKDKSKIIFESLAFNYLLRACGWVLLALAPSLPALFIVEIMYGISEAYGSPAFNSLVSENLDNKKHISEWGMWEVLKSPSVALGSIASGFIVAGFGFRVLFAVMAAFSFLALAILLKGGFNKHQIKRI